MRRIQCPNCGSKDIEQDEKSGQSVCTACGTILEENAIVNSVEFVEGAGGSASMVGSFVGRDGKKTFSGNQGRRGGGYGLSRDSREMTLVNAKRRIEDVASRLRLNSHYVDTAHRHFTIAVERNFVKGRRTTHVVAACLYLACRQEKSHHMLIDFSDALEVNVYTLGTCFLKFRRLLGLQVAIVDPMFYLYRFAGHLGLEGKANDVVITAMRLVGRMKRDWIVMGRRPAGICAAALLIAARAHGFTKRHQDVTKILRVCGMTVKTRIKEFECTPAANLTLDQFIKIDLTSEADPPKFTTNRIQEARAQAIQEGNVDLLTSGKLDDPRHNSKYATKWRQSVTVSEKQKEMNQLYSQLATEMKGNEGGKHHDESDSQIPDSTAAMVTQQSQTQDLSKENTQDALVTKDAANQMSLSNIAFPKGNNGKDLVLPNSATSEELQKSTQKEEDKLDLEEWKKDMPSDYMDEIDDLFRDDDEMKEREAIFNKMNKDYIEKQQEKENDRIAAENAQKEQDEDYANQIAESSRYRRRRAERSRAEGGPSTHDALLATFSARKTSRKINYDALSAIFDDAGSFSTDLLEDNEPDKTLTAV